MNLFRRYIASLSLLFSCAVCLAVPAKRGDLRLVQPDGKTITVNIYGDESGHLVRMKDGSAVMLADDGFYHYAVRDGRGNLVATEYIAGGRVPDRIRQLSAAVKLQRVKKTGPSIPEIRPSEADESSGPGKAVIVLAEFKDLEFKNGRAQFENLLARVASYFTDQTDGKMDFVFDVTPVATLSRGYAYYGENDPDGNDMRAAEAVQEAVDLVDPEVDFSEYDYLYVFYAGGSPADGSADDDHIWPHSASNVRISSAEKDFRKYAMSSELMTSEKTGNPIFTGIGTFCHEYGHQLGLMDLYDSDYEKSGGIGDGLWWTTSLMDGGCYNNNSNTPPCFNAIELEQLGIVEPEQIEIGEYNLKPLSDQKRILRMDTDNPGEYFLFECRTASGWDEYIGAAGGLLVYHIDRSDNEAGYSEKYDRNLTARQRWMMNEVNARTDHPCADIVKADPTVHAYAYDPETGRYVMRLDNLYRIFFPCGTYTELSSKSFQQLEYWDGRISPLSVLNIARNQSSVSFMVAGPIVIDIQNVYQDAFILNWHTDMDSFMNAPAKLVLHAPDGDTEYEVMPYSRGMFAYTFDGLNPGTAYSYTLSFDDGTEADTSVTGSFVTKVVNGMPFIYLQDTKRTVTGYFTAASLLPLRVYNATDAVSVVWTLDGRPVKPGPDGFFHLVSGGLLKAVVTYPDGSRDVITKEIMYK